MADKVVDEDNCEIPGPNAMTFTVFLWFGSSFSLCSIWHFLGPCIPGRISPFCHSLSNRLLEPERPVVARLLKLWKDLPGSASRE